MTDHLSVRSVALGPLQANCFILSRGADALVVDPGDEATQVIRLVARLEVAPRAILLTHGHFDHFGAAEPLARIWNVPVYIGDADADQVSDPGSGTTWGFDVPAVTAERVIMHGEEELPLPIPVLAIPTPGHSQGSFTFQTDGHLFSGDLIFYGSVGRTDLPGGSSRTLIQSIAGLVRRFPPATIVHCGHGPDTTLGRELAVNPFFAPLRNDPEASR
jgi:glyoxylase-like metal-dependent hydrolase (beta-lactamase superfamily II)